MTMLLKYKIIFLLCFICADALILRSRSSEEDSDESSSSEEKGKNKNKDKWDKDWNKDKWDRDWNKDKNKDKKIKFECPAPNGMFPDTSDCSRYYLCVINRAKSKKCNKKHHFDMFRKACLPKIIAVCDDGKGKQKTTKATTVYNTKPTPPKDRFTCPDNFGTFPHPEDCAKFYDCFFFRPTLKTCPDNTLFDGVKKQCKPESQVHCGSRRRPTTHQPGTTRQVTPSFKTTRSVKPTPSKLSTDTSRSTRKFEEPTTLQVTTEEQTTVSSTTEELTTPQITTEEPTTVEEITTTESPTTVEEITTTELPTTLEEITTTELPTTVEEITTTELPTTVEEITTTEVEPTGPPETNCDEDDLDCIIKETGEIPKWFKCPNDIGSFPHPSSPKLFIFCKNKKPKVKKCGQNLIYRDSLKTCVAP